MDSIIDNQKGGGKSPAIRQLYPELADEQLQEAEANLHRYFAFAMKLIEPSTGNPPSGLDAPAPSFTMKERSNNSLKN